MTTRKPAPPDALTVACPRCAKAPAGEPCRNYKGQRKPPCRQRWVVARVAAEAKARAAADPDLNPESPCSLCGEPTIRGVNSDFCSLACELEHDHQEALQEHRERQAAAPRSPRTDPAWRGTQMDLFQTHLTEAKPHP